MDGWNKSMASPFASEMEIRHYQAPLERVNEPGRMAGPATVVEVGLWQGGEINKAKTQDEIDAQR